MITNVFDEGTLTRRVDGTRANDVITSTNFNLFADNGTTISGFAGDDFIISVGGDDTIFGDDGSDTLDGGQGKNSIDGGNGDDSLLARVDGVGSESQLRGQAGDDSFYILIAGDDDNVRQAVAAGGTGYDTVTVAFASGLDAYTLLLNSGELSLIQLTDGTGESRPTVGGVRGVERYSFTTKVIFDGSSEAETAIGSRFDDLFEGFGKNDLFEGAGGSDTLKGGAQNDILIDSTLRTPTFPEAEPDTLMGGNQSDLLISRGGEDVLQGGKGDDFLIVTAGPGLLEGGGGRDYIGISNQPGEIRSAFRSDFEGFGAYFDTEVSMTLDQMQGAVFDGGGGNKDTLSLQNLQNIENESRLFSGATLNLKTGEGYFEVLSGFEAPRVTFEAYKFERFFGTDGDDSVDAGRSDTLLVGSRGDDLLQGNIGKDTLDGGKGADDLQGGGGGDLLKGGASGDALNGQDGRDTLEGGAGNDLLDGGRRADTIEGGRGNDTIISGAGYDMVTGDAGTDVFHILPPESGGSVFVHITDFDDFGRQQDEIRLGGFSIADIDDFLDIEEIGGSDTVPFVGTGVAGTLITLTDQARIFLEGIPERRIDDTDFGLG